MLQLCGVIVICALVAVIICLATKNGKQAAKLKELKRELDGISRAQELAASVYSMGSEEARRKLQEVSNKLNKK